MVEGPLPITERSTGESVFIGSQPDVAAGILHHIPDGVAMNGKRIAVLMQKMLGAIGRALGIRRGEQIDSVSFRSHPDAMLVVFGQAIDGFPTERSRL